MEEVEINLFNLIIFIGVAQGIIFTLVTLLTKLRHQKALVYLSYTVLFLSLNNLQYWAREIQLTASLPYARHLLLPFYFLIVPSFYRFFTHYLGIETRLPSFSFSTNFLFYGSILIRIGLFYYVDQVLPDHSDQVLIDFNLIEETVCILYSIFIFGFASYIIYNNPSWYREVKDYDDLSWIKQFFKYGSLVLILWVLAILQSYLVGFFKPPESYYPVRLGTSFLIYWVGYRGLFRYRILRDRMDIRRNMQADYFFKELEKRESDETQNPLLAKFEEIVVTQKKYLDPMIGLESLSSDLEVSQSHLSQMINKHYGSNLTSYVNALRVEQAKKMLVDSSYSKYTILAVGLESGFNSKSTFYNAFKKHTSLSPSEFQKQHSNK